jgi:hypothetical protein
MPEIPDSPAPLSLQPLRRCTLQIEIPLATKCAAERLARDYARRPLAIVLAALVNDLAVAQERSGSWEHERATSWLGSHVWEVEPPGVEPRLRADEVMGSAYGAYPWDGWEKWVRAQGVTAELAKLGRAVIREAWQHGWDEPLCELCGWCDDGAQMLQLALRDPVLAEQRWSRWLETDGGRYDPETNETL